MQYVNTKQLSQMIGISQVTLETWRVKGEGPPYHKLGRRVVYSVSAVEAWMGECRVGGQQ